MRAVIFLLIASAAVGFNTPVRSYVARGRWTRVRGTLSTHEVTTKATASVPYSVDEPRDQQMAIDAMVLSKPVSSGHTGGKPMKIYNGAASIGKAALLIVPFVYIFGDYIYKHPQLFGQ